MIGDHETSDFSPGETNKRRFRLFSRGPVDFAISENEITATENWRAPTPLPNAPDSVVGVVGIHGRMLTVLDLAKIAGVAQGSVKTENSDSQQLILALQGDEQLALVVDAERESIDVSDEVLDESGSRDLMTTINHAGSALNVLNPRQLFLSAIQGRERRRRRF